MPSAAAAASCSPPTPPAPPPPTPPAALLFLHGRGDTAAGWAPAFPLPASPPLTAVVLPTAPATAVTHDGGAVMPAWFDAPPASAVRDAPAATACGLAASVGRLSAAVAALVAGGIPAPRIVVGGFSQGAAVAAELVAAGTWRLGGAMLVGGWLPTGGGRAPPPPPLRQPRPRRRRRPTAAAVPGRPTRRRRRRRACGCSSSTAPPTGSCPRLRVPPLPPR
ncbi:hypothetical protein BU14_0134s0002 [Porphyra umbilicalis]|uniref:Phospholipase/carboxylesterase/thioesterase domain-containing protein n=1 Tax=Porphyra umbilicalis TaxID=2786 RepID=A0A1X6PAK4_PORUM|nr:hypothetical protein BU14_0134s0002 [Porphyra umbilicalis]|eukprot:OSX77780.1 hypothetical protein BU14_0134s0002 [Porphyra umbilicalis]